MKKLNQKGFSMIELMIVVAIIGFLVAMGAPQYQKFQMKAKQSEAKSLLSSMYTVQKAFFAEWTQYYAHFDALGYGLEGSLGYNIGFAANGVAGPANHPTYSGTAATSATRIAGEYCSMKTECNTDNSGVPVSETVTGTVTVGTPTDAVKTFTAGAVANLDSDATFDRWTIDQNKTFRTVAGSNDIEN